VVVSFYVVLNGLEPGDVVMRVSAESRSSLRVEGVGWVRWVGLEHELVGAIRWAGVAVCAVLHMAEAVGGVGGVAAVRIPA